MGHVDGGSLSGLSLGGTLDILGEPEAGGGLIGKVAGGATVFQCRNIATFPSGITGYQPGGIIGELIGSTLSMCLNGMTGDIIGIELDSEIMASPRAGGICGYISGDVTVDFAVNSMRGNITSERATGGIVGYVVSLDNGATTFTRVFNYMTGNLTVSDTLVELLVTCTERVILATLPSLVMPRSPNQS